MSSFLQKALQLITGETDDFPVLQMPKNWPGKKLTERQLLQLESQVGSKIFGAIPAGHRREFFCLDEDTWIWHEEGKDPNTGKHVQHTIRYEMHENGILKVQEGARYSFLEGDELTNFMAAIRVYHDQVARDIYNRDPVTGHELA